MRGTARLLTGLALALWMVQLAGAVCAGEADPQALRGAIAKSFVLLQHTVKTATERAESKCISCHHQGLLPAKTTVLARERGFAVDEDLAKAQLRRVHQFLSNKHLLYAMAVQGNVEAMKKADQFLDLNVSFGYLLSGLAEAHWPADNATATAALLLAKRQLPDGRWDFDFPRTPMQSSDFTTTALAVKVLQKYGPKEHDAALAQHLARAKAWLLANTPRTTDDKTGRLFGLAWTQAESAEIQKAVTVLLAEQRPDGGWAQKAGLPTDAYATGQVLVALHEAGGVAVQDPAYQRGVAFLLQTQKEDGSWFVQTRAIQANPDFIETGFPHGKSQFISFPGSCWATMALLLTLEPAK